MVTHRDPHSPVTRRIAVLLFVSLLLLSASRAFAATQTFEAGWDVWVARDATSLSCSGPYFFRSNCQDIVLARYSGNSDGRTYIALDFDTNPLPDNAIIDAVTLSLYTRNFGGGEIGQVPGAPLDCGDLDFFLSGGTLDNVQVGIYWRGVPSVGYNASNPDDVVTEACNPAWSGIKVVVQTPSTATAPGWLDYPLFPTIFYPAPPVTATQVTRYGIDLEIAPEGVLRALLFDSVWRTNGNKARLAVTYHLPPPGGGCRPPCELDKASPAAREGVQGGATPWPQTSWGRVKSIYR